MSGLPRQVETYNVRRRHFINRRIQLGVTVSLAALAASVAIGLAAYSFMTAGNEIDCIRMRAHVPYSNARQAAGPALLWGASGAFALVAVVAAVASILTSRRARSISRHFSPLFQKMTNGEPVAPTSEATGADAELASAYVELMRAHDRITTRARASAEHIADLLAHMRLRPDAAATTASLISRESWKILDEVNNLRPQTKAEG